MTEQEQFEADYLAAFPDHGDRALDKYVSGRYVCNAAFFAFPVWLQQAKRHEAEIAELMTALKFAHAVMRQWKPILPPPPCHLSNDRDLCIQEVGSIIAKYEARP